MKVNSISFIYHIYIIYVAEVVLTRLTVQYCEQYTCRHCYVDQNVEITPKLLRKAIVPTAEELSFGLWAVSLVPIGQ
jgi:hypothetical protein